ncbi:MAG: hypothetical protein IPJ20_24740 [Flammeovirgaceae bacterium]|nr:hypothetical protein [Flammeovirgaceae bacterium]
MGLYHDGWQADKSLATAQELVKTIPLELMNEKTLSPATLVCRSLVYNGKIWKME